MYVYIKYIKMTEPEPVPVPVPEPVQPVIPTENAKEITLNKNGKPRKTLSAEALEKLKLAREKANAIRQQACVKKREDETALIEDKISQFEKGEINSIPEVLTKPKKMTRGKKKTKIIVEQSSEDSDEFEPNDHVVFVKRVSRKKKSEQPVTSPLVEPDPAPQSTPEISRQITQRQLTPQELQLKNQYNQMFSGGFMRSKRSFY